MAKLKESTEDKITHNTCSMQYSMGTGLLRQGKCLNFLWLLSVNTHFPDEHSKYSLFLFSRGGGGGGVICLYSFLVDQNTQGLMYNLKNTKLRP